VNAINATSFYISIKRSDLDEVMENMKEGIQKTT
jgi:hypothetical protein